MALIVVTGPPAAGKTTYVTEHAKPGDIRIDLDHIANALAGEDTGNHEHASHILTVAKAARRAAIDAAMKQDCTVWLIHTKPTPKQLNDYEAMGATIHTIDPGKGTVMKRCKAERPKASLIAAAKWYDNKPAAKKSTHERGYGHQHQQQRRKLMAQLKDGTPCPECGKPMFKTAAKNFDGAALEADHGPGSALKYAENKQATKATRLLHRTCNRSGGAWDKPKKKPRESGENAGQGFVWA
ncbi:AAA family ATPase [Corynebacterium aurimucosum]|uniref:AAA family ATPase n=1 Tax=Corynebacterium aurimucosum TaxID=169292 RepID=UPI0039905040